jgi:HEAT repeat protein
MPRPQTREQSGEPRRLQSIEQVDEAIAMLTERHDRKQVWTTREGAALSLKDAAVENPAFRAAVTARLPELHRVLIERLYGDARGPEIRTKVAELLSALGHPESAKILEQYLPEEKNEAVRRNILLHLVGWPTAEGPAAVMRFLNSPKPPKELVEIVSDLAPIHIHEKSGEELKRGLLALVNPSIPRDMRATENARVAAIKALQAWGENELIQVKLAAVTRDAQNTDRIRDAAANWLAEVRRQKKPDFF